jgi:hypothetical protein
MASAKVEIIYEAEASSLKANYIQSLFLVYSLSIAEQIIQGSLGYNRRIGSL